MPLHVRVSRQREGYFVVSLSGNLDSQTAASLEQHLQPLLAGKAQVVLLDLALLHYISSLGLRVVLKTRKELEARNARLILSNLQPQIAKVFEIAKALPPQTIFASLAEADRYFDAIQQQELDRQAAAGRRPKRPS